MNLKGNEYVEVVLFTFNQEQLVADAINSVLMQRVNFPLQIRIHDDASDDGTLLAAKSVLEKSPYPWSIFSQDTNQYSKGYQFYADFIFSTKAKYIAFIDGDDLWTDPLKLQKQFDLLESNLNVAICHHPFGVLRGNEISLEDWRPLHLRGGDRSGNELAFTNFIGASTVMLRSECLPRNINANFDQSPVGDYPIWALSSQFGRIQEISECMSLYREHDSNIYAVLDPEVRRRKDLTAKSFILANIDKENQDIWLEGILDAASWHLGLNKIKQEINDLTSLLEQERKSYSSLISEHHSLLQSTSWKITSPFRKILGFLRSHIK